MLLYILLSLGQVFANQQLAHKVYECVDRMARNPLSAIAHDTILEVAEECNNEVSHGKLKVEVARLEGPTRTHTLILSEPGHAEPYLFTFNIIGTKLCNEEKKPIKNLLIDINLILSNTENSYSANSCDPNATEEDKYLAPMFGFKKSHKNKKCERACKSGEILVGIPAPFIFARHREHGGLDLHDLGRPDSSVPSEIDTQMLDVKCKKCPMRDSSYSSNYMLTKPDSNKCYDSQGCEEGEEYLRHEVINMTGGGCMKRCYSSQIRNDTGDCVPDPKKVCQQLVDGKTHLKKIKERFLNLSDSTKIGICNINIFKPKIKAWAAEREQYINQAIAKKCVGFDIENFKGNSVFFHYLTGNSAEINSTAKCLGPMGKNPLLDIDAYSLLNENIFEDLQDSRFIY